MARAGLGDGWRCAFANDFDSAKTAVYRANWGDEGLVEADVNRLTTSDLPGQADLAWASFPCQDLSLAGGYAGIRHRSAPDQTRSGAFWPFWQLMHQLKEEGRAPKLVALENVLGTLTANQGQDFVAIGNALSDTGYRFGALVIDASLFLPQSRPRLFIVGVRGDLMVPTPLTTPTPSSLWHPNALRSAQSLLPEDTRRNWLWWTLPEPPPRTSRFADVIEEEPGLVAWHSRSQTAALLALMNPRHLAKLEAAKHAGRRMVGGVYKRTRVENGHKVQRAEVRFDDIAGCLRTPAGGSSRQSILVVDGKSVRSRLLSPREAARLMGLQDGYVLPNTYYDAYHLAGDGVAVPVVRHLATHLFAPLLALTTAVATAGMAA